MANNQYAQALWNIAHRSEGEVAPKKLVQHLAEHLKRTDRLKLLPSILRDLQRLEARHTRLAPQVEAASESEAKQALKEAAAAGIHAEHAVINPSLIKGWRASERGKLVDTSAKQQLITLYRNITT